MRVAGRDERAMRHHELVACLTHACASSTGGGLVCNRCAARTLLEARTMISWPMERGLRTELQWVADWAVATTVFSILVAVAVTLALSAAVARLPEDYLLRVRPENGSRHVLRRGVGILLVAAGIVMLLVPGPGVVSIVVGLIVLDVPWLRRHLVALVSRPRVVAALNAARRRVNRPPLSVPAAEPADDVASGRRT
jgi:putative transmembrane protein PGPGW